MLNTVTGRAMIGRAIGHPPLRARNDLIWNNRPCDRVPASTNILSSCCIRVASGDDQAIDRWRARAGASAPAAYPFFGDGDLELTNVPLLFNARFRVKAIAASAFYWQA